VALLPIGGFSAWVAEMPPAPDVSVVLVAYESRAYLGACLDALPRAFADRSYEVILVDNDSTDGGVEHARACCPEARVIRMGYNAGFARACNLGTGAAEGRFLLFLNPDTMPEPGSLARLADVLVRDPSIAIAGPRLVNPDLSDQGTARAFPTPAAALFGRRSRLRRLWPTNPWSRRYMLEDRSRPEAPGVDTAFDVDWLSGACIMVRRDIIEKFGSFDAHFFMYWEDADLCRRVKGAGGRVVCEPSARVIHDEGAQRGHTARQVVHFHRSAYRYYAKHELCRHPSPAGRGLRPPST
jgi:N-acetylglucosaminyl-diphospho-decaprenol L-rhamnosyltransferase